MSTGLWDRVRCWLFGSPQERQSPAQRMVELVERSGVGAGTEACLACQGRIANIGALTVATVEDDRRTISIWRCRTCRTCFLNDWTNRWQRLDSLQTEETYYRLAPAEALQALAVIEGVVGGEHPAGRHQRTEQRDWFEEWLAHHQPLSHQVRHGR